MQLRLPWTVEEPAPGRVRPSPPATPRRSAGPPRVNTARQLLVAGEPVALHVVRHRRARRYVVRVADDGSVRLTVPYGASIAGGIRFAERQTAWVERERGRQRERAGTWHEGHVLWFRGERVAISVRPGVVVIGGEVVRIAPGADVRVAAESYLRAIATAELTSRCLELASEYDFILQRITVRNQKSRWGACSSKGVITLNWRLIQMPASVSDYVVFHELAHLKQPNHSRRFWKEVEKICPYWREAERWLRKHGREIL